MKVKLGKYPKGNGSRKIDVQIEPFDTWSLDHTLALIIYPALLQLKATKHGIPGDFSEVGGESYSAQDSFDFYKESADDAFDIKCKQWDDIMDKMIWSFEQLLKDDYDGLYHHGKGEYDFVESETLYPNPVTGQVEKTYKMVDKNPEGHWYDHVGHHLHEARIQEGFDLFGRYFRSLWD